jgi:hypothetical protein
MCNDRLNETLSLETLETVTGGYEGTLGVTPSGHFKVKAIANANEAKLCLDAGVGLDVHVTGDDGSKAGWRGQAGVAGCFGFYKR